MREDDNLPLNILVADDSATIRRFLLKAISARLPNANLVEAANGTDCLTTLSSLKFDVAFVDVNMPGMTGMEAVAQARGKGIDTFVVMMSTEWSPERVETAHKLKVYEYLTKPFDKGGVDTILGNFQRFTRPTSVLLVDDSAATRSVIKKVFHDSLFNLQVDEAEDGPSALFAYKSGHHDIVFLDVNMPGIDGLETLRMLRTLNDKVRVALITSDRSKNLEKSVRSDAAQSVLYKPFFQDDVDRVLHELFGLRAPTFGEAAHAGPDLVEV